MHRQSNSCEARDRAPPVLLSTFGSRFIWLNLLASSRVDDAEASSKHNLNTGSNSAPATGRSSHTESQGAPEHFGLPFNKDIIPVGRF
eukprot:5615250-Karenia_brevis.AAC.1